MSADTSLSGRVPQGIFSEINAHSFKHVHLSHCQRKFAGHFGDIKVTILTPALNQRGAKHALTISPPLGWQHAQGLWFELSYV